jgi:hypothetical protein
MVGQAVVCGGPEAQEAEDMLGEAEEDAQLEQRQQHEQAALASHDRRF